MTKSVVLLAYFISVAFYALVLCKHGSEICNIVMNNNIVIDVTKLTEKDRKQYEEVKEEYNSLLRSPFPVEINFERIIRSCVILCCIAISLIPIVRCIILIRNTHKIDELKNSIVK